MMPIVLIFVVVSIAISFPFHLKTMFIVLSGLSFGYTGSYIFSQTIFTYRTGVHSRWIGALCVLMLAYVVVSPINVLEVSPLFFLGSALIFIGYVLFLFTLLGVL